TVLAKVHSYRPFLLNKLRRCSAWPEIHRWLCCNLKGDLLVSTYGCPTEGGPSPTRRLPLPALSRERTEAGRGAGLRHRAGPLGDCDQLALDIRRFFVAPQTFCDAQSARPGEDHWV